MSDTSQPSPGVGPGQPSRTSILVAAGRAFGHRDPDAGVRNPDWLAERFVGPAERAQIGDHPIASALDGDYADGWRKMEVAGIASMMIVRTCVIDAYLERAVAAGATQVVILGAGFDTRAYRFAELLAETKVFEVDYHSTQAFKKRRVEEVVGVPPNVTFVEIDFQTQKLGEVLRAAGYRSDVKTCFIWEGVSMYLGEPAVRETLRTIGNAAPGTTLIMDFAGRGMLALMDKFPDHPQRKYTAGWGEPWIFGVPDGKEKEFFRECGLDLKTTTKFWGGDVNKRYLTRADGTRVRPNRREMRRDPEARKATVGSMSRMKRMGIVFSAIWIMVVKRSKGYALAEMVVPERKGA